MSTLRVDEITNEAGDGPPGGAASFFTQTVDTTDWAGTEPAVATLTVTGVKSTDRPVIDLDLSSTAFASVADIQSAWGSVYRVEASADNEVKLYATDVPTEDLPVLIKVVR